MHEDAPLNQLERCRTYVFVQRVYNADYSFLLRGVVGQSSRRVGRAG